MKVAFIHPDLGIGGAERLVLDVAVALQKKDIEVIFITNHFDKSHAFEELKNGQFPVRVIGDSIPRSICGLFQALCAYIRMFYLSLVYMLFLVQHDKPDVFFVDQIPMANFVLRLYKQKIIYYCHHPDLLATPHDTFLKKLYRGPIDFIEEKGTKISDIILVNSKYTASVFYNTFPSIKQRIHVLYPTIASSYLETIANIEPKDITTIISEMNYKSGDVVYLSINRYHPAKKLELAIEAMDCLKSILSSSDWAKVHLIIAGGYDPQSSINKFYFNRLVHLSNSKNLNEKVMFLKSPSDGVKVDLLTACDCLLYTPINEHFGIVPLEAMAVAKPVIACNSGGPCETIENELNGYLSEPTPDEIAKCMKQILDKNKARQMGLKGKERLESIFSYEMFSLQAVDVVKRAVEENFTMENKDQM